VIINLLNNSMKFSQPDTAITLSMRLVQAGDIKLPASKKTAGLKNLSYMLFCVKDQGTGMEQKYADRIFDRFYQIENPHVRKHEGIGLGLNIAKSIVEAHEGMIWAESPGTDKGSSFYFILPAA
jgi:signal transduction histidine kinase